jgi:hypothetical protein
MNLLPEDFEGIATETPEYIEVSVGHSAWKTLDGLFISESVDCKVSGEIWRIYKNDPDPFPSNPHAHCIGGERYIGCKLHLGTGELFRNSQSLKRRLDNNQFMRLIELIRPKFPGVTLPITC